MTNILEQLKNRLFAKWVACSIISDKKSVQFGIRFSYPIFILILAAGLYFENRLIIFLAAVIAFLAIKLPLHPFDYFYNHVVANLIRSQKIPGRGSELQVNSAIVIVFVAVVLALISFNIPINYAALAIIYTLSSVVSICSFLLQD